MVSNQQFRLKWNNHRNTVLQEFETLLHNNSFVDCTIGADGKYLKAHKIILSACSPYLQNVFSEHFDKHPVILLKDVTFKELKCMIDYMYCGEVNISECELPSFLRTAQSLKIKGLAEDLSNDYDSGSDSEQQDLGSALQASVEIKDDEKGPPSKKKAPALISANTLTPATRKRKLLNNTSSSRLTSESKIPVASSTPISNRLAAGGENGSEISTSSNTTSSVNKDEKTDSSKKVVSSDEVQNSVVAVKSRLEVKEEPVDADDDNSSYEFASNVYEDSDPLNEDSDQNCTSTGKSYNEISIASVSSLNEPETNDQYVPTTKDEIPQEERRIRVRSAIELMPLPKSIASTSSSPIIRTDIGSTIELMPLPKSIASTSTSPIIRTDIGSTIELIPVVSGQTPLTQKNEPLKEMKTEDSNAIEERSWLSRRSLQRNSKDKAAVQLLLLQKSSVNSVNLPLPPYTRRRGRISRKKMATDMSNLKLRAILPAPLAPRSVAPSPHMLPASVPSPYTQATTVTALEPTPISADGNEVVDVATEEAKSPIPEDPVMLMPPPAAEFLSTDGESSSSQSVYMLNPPCVSQAAAQQPSTSSAAEASMTSSGAVPQPTASSSSSVPQVTKFRKIAPLMPSGLEEGRSSSYPCVYCLRICGSSEELQLHMIECAIWSKRSRNKKAKKMFF